MTNTKKCQCGRGAPDHTTLYAERDIEGQREVYAVHVYHMTSEGLYSKSAIAAELAHRDIHITELETENATLRARIKELEDSDFSVLAAQARNDLRDRAEAAELEQALSTNKPSNSP